MRRLFVGLLAVVLSSGVLAGCAAIPTNTQPKPIDPSESRNNPVNAPQPAKDIDALTLVRDFVDASANPDGDFAEAKAYLTDDARKRWETKSPTIIDPGFSTVPTSQTPLDKQQVVLLQGKNLGRLEPDSSFVPLTTDLNVGIRVEKNADGQWRISEPPDGVYMTQSRFLENYKRVTLYFYNPEFTVLVPDARYIVIPPSTGIPQRVSELLVRGPGVGVRGALFSALGERAGFHAATKEADDGALEVNLSKLGDLTPQSRKQIVAQVVKSLSGVTSSRIRVLVEGAPILPDRREWRPSDVVAWSGESLITPNPDERGMIVAGGSVRSFGDGNPIKGPAGDGSYNAVSGAQSLDGSRLAVVGKAGNGMRLLVGDKDQGLAEVALPSASLTRPTWLVSGEARQPSNEVWTVADGTNVARVTRSDNGVWTASAVNTAELSGFGQITELRLSRDGTRVGMVIGGKLYVAAVVRNPQDASVSIRTPRQLLPSVLGAAVQSLDWLSQDVMVVSSSLPANPVTRVYLDGSKYERYNQSNLTVPVTSVTAAVSRAVIAVDHSGLWTASDITDVWRSTGVRPEGDVVVFYPG
ncbi:lipoprotein [Lentzea sp. NBRC 105346]|uniref:LpqB family beta-propeller domain-containing protein n=1 Tax=Lentzea sp. NBRC 105346 TaxID=3032205 RepID=UPI0024A5A014|nr:LpqB family beta-propeller domain-containing protein [Lentzea sp. NBRC 105346]GLZ35738.1 lipoprotein [Lentzea sp. NBRC 105346]